VEITKVENFTFKSKVKDMKRLESCKGIWKRVKGGEIVKVVFGVDDDVEMVLITLRNLGWSEGWRVKMSYDKKLNTLHIQKGTNGYKRVHKTKK